MTVTVVALITAAAWLAVYLLRPDQSRTAQVAALVIGTAYWTMTLIPAAIVGLFVPSEIVPPPLMAWYPSTAVAPQVVIPLLAAAMWSVLAGWTQLRRRLLIAVSAAYALTVAQISRLWEGPNPGFLARVAGALTKPGQWIAGALGVPELFMPGSGYVRRMSVSDSTALHVYITAAVYWTIFTVVVLVRRSRMKPLALIAVTLCASTLAAQQPNKKLAPQSATEKVNWASGVTYTYDGAGSVTHIGQDAFGYDDAGRLVQAKVNDVTRSYDYDALGNRKNCTEVGPGDCQTGGVSLLNNHLDQATYSASGNVETLLNHTYSYDSLNMMTRDTFGGVAREFVYTAEDERIATDTIGLTSTWQWTLRDKSGKVLREFSSDGGTSWKWLKDYVWRDNVLVATRQPESTQVTTYHYHTDHLGTPRRVTDDNERIVGVHDYFAFGPEISSSTAEPSPTALKYTGQERDSWSGSNDSLDYIHSRYYSPYYGRFMSTDMSHRINPSMPQTWNRYTYALNNPFTLYDPAGEWPTHVLHVHQAAIDRALAFLPAHDRKILKEQQVEVDKDQSTAASFRHAMRGTGQSEAQARAEANLWVRSSIENARHMEAVGQHAMAMVSLGDAIHTLQDATSPTHAGFQEWNGDWHAWDPRVLAHVKGEFYDPGAGSELDQATLQAWKYFTGELAMPDDFFASTPNNCWQCMPSSVVPVPAAMGTMFPNQ